MKRNKMSRRVGRGRPARDDLERERELDANEEGEQRQRNDVEPPVPDVFQLTPYGKTLNLNEEKDTKLFKSASDPFEVTFNGEAKHATSFIDKIRNRTNHIQCTDIFTVTNENGERISIFDKWQSLELRRVKEEATQRWQVNDWKKQASYITGKVIMESLGEEFRARVIQHNEDYQIEAHGTKQNDGPLLLKVILDLVYIQTDMEGFTIRETLSKIHLKDYKYDLIEVHRKVMDLIAQLRSTPDEISDNATKLHLVNIYKTAKSDKFCDFIEQLQNFGRLPKPNELIKLAEKKYQQLLDDGLWLAPSKQEQLLAFKVENEKLKKENKSLKKSKKRKSKENPSRNSSKKQRRGARNDEWLTIAPKKHEKTTIERDGKTWNWCKFHNKWVIAKSAKFGEHSSETCLLNPKNQKKERKLKVVANMATEGGSQSSSSESDGSESGETEGSSSE